MSTHPRALQTEHGVSYSQLATETVQFVDGYLLGLPALQIEVGAHLVALAGMIALAALGGILFVRNYFRGDAISSEASTTQEEYVTDRERVCQLVESNGGRMKQSDIVDSVSWSKAKVSRLLAELESDGEVTKLRLGRENLICLDGHEPTASKSPEQPKSE